MPSIQDAIDLLQQLSDEMGGGLTVSGGVTVAPSTADGLTPYYNNSLSNAGVSIKAAAGQVYGWYIHNTANGPRYVKFYDKATAPSSADVPLFVLSLPAGSAANVMSFFGIEFAAGIGIRATSGVADNDNTAPAANDVIANIFYF